MLFLLSLFFVPFVQGNITWGILRQAKTEQQHKHKANCEPRAREGGAVKLKRGEGRRRKGACKLQPPACKMFTILQFRDSTVLLLCVVVRVTISEEEEE